MPPVASGLDHLVQNPSLAPSGRIGLITNHSAVTAGLAPGVDALRGAGLNIAALFGPEHGVRGDVAAGQHVESGSDPRTGLPVHSLYGPNKKPSPEMMEGIDAFIFDMQDVGARFYTFLSTLGLCMEAAGERGIPILVLDRPNPLGGEVVEGPVVKAGFESFVGFRAFPIRYGLTVGELAQCFRDHFGIACDLSIGRLSGWKRKMEWEATGLPWVMPSPNMPVPETVRVFPGTCFIEGTNLSEGRGTSKPFETFGAPYIDADDLADALNALELPGAQWRPLHFIPTFSKHNGEACHGCQLHVTDPAAFRPVTAGVHLLSVLKRLYRDEFDWLPPFNEGRPHFIDLLAGTDALRIGIEDGVPAPEILRAWDEDREAFEPARNRAMIYTD
jgi:uncharacterized protein YbbC (DUF1343 family)